MNKFTPFLVYVAALGFSVITALVLFSYGKSKVTENALVKADDERRCFLGVTLLKLAENEAENENITLNLESRYPLYKAHGDMIREFARKDYSEWVASIITGSTETEFEDNVFEYLTTQKLLIFY